MLSLYKAFKSIGQSNSYTTTLNFLSKYLLVLQMLLTFFAVKSESTNTFTWWFSGDDCHKDLFLSGMKLQIDI